MRLSKSIIKIIFFCFICLIIVGINDNIVHAVYDTTKDCNYEKTGYHLESANSWTCDHNIQNASTIECNCTGLNVDDTTIDNSIHIKLGSGAPAFQITNRWNEILEEYTGIVGLNPVGHYMEISNVGNGNSANKFGFTASRPWNREGNEHDSSKWGYAYFGIEFSYCQSTGMYYYVGTYHTWYGALNGTAGAIGHNIYPYSHTVTLYNIVPNTYQIVYDANGGYGDMKDYKATVNYDEDVRISYSYYSSPSGKRFTGWNTKADGSGTAYIPGDTYRNLADGSSITTITLYAQYTDNNYSILYNANGGYGSMEDYDLNNVICGEMVRIYDNHFIRQGYEFTGWNTKADGSGTLYQPASGSYTTYPGLTNSDGIKIILYAQWKPVTYTVRYDANGGIGSIKTQTFIYNDTYTQKYTIAANAYVKNGYAFTSWNTDKTGHGGSFFSGDTDTKRLIDYADSNHVITMHAQWSNDSYIIQYSAGIGGSGSDYLTSVSRNIVVYLLGHKECNFTSGYGYLFDKWYSSPFYDSDDLSYEGNQGVSNLAAAGTYIRLFARWKAELYYDANGGSGSMVNQTVYGDTSFMIGANGFTAPAGCVFTGWNTKADGTGDAYSEGQTITAIQASDGRIVLYAQWKNISYTVRYIGNGASGSMPDQIMQCDITTALSSNQFSKEYASFKGWNTKKDGSGTAYNDCAKVMNLVPAGQTITLYAQWKSIIQEKAGHFVIIRSTNWIDGKVIYNIENTQINEWSEEVQLNIKTGNDRFDNQDFIVSWTSAKEDIDRYKKDLKEKGEKYVINRLKDYYSDDKE